MYKIKWLNFNDPRHVLGFYWFVLRITSLLPYKIIIVNEQMKYVSQRPSIFKMGEMAVSFGLIYYCQIIRYSLIDPNDFVSYMGIITQYNVLSFVACASTITFLFTHSNYVNCMNSLAEIDKEFRELGIYIMYNYWFLLCCSYASNIIFVPIMLNATERDFIKTVLDLVAFHHPVVIRFAAMSMPVLCMGIIYEHFMKLNKKLKCMFHHDINENTLEESMDQTERSKAELVLNKITKIHTELISTTTELNDGFTFIILLNAVSNITQVVLALLFIYAGNYKEVSPLELTISFTLYTIQMGAQYLFSFLVPFEAQETLVLIGQLNIYYSDKSLAIKKNTLLLQGKHHKLDLRICSVVPLNLSVFLKQISICSTLFLILLQFYRKSQGF